MWKSTYKIVRVSSKNMALRLTLSRRELKNSSGETNNFKRKNLQIADKWLSSRRVQIIFTDPAPVPSWESSSVSLLDMADSEWLPKSQILNTLNKVELCQK